MTTTTPTWDHTMSRFTEQVDFILGVAGGGIEEVGGTHSDLTLTLVKFIETSLLSKLKLVSHESELYQEKCGPLSYKILSSEYSAQFILNLKQDGDASPTMLSKILYSKAYTTIG